MITGASTANLAIILVDARNGIVEQTRRHSFIASLLGIPHIVYCINKMDLVNYKQESYEGIKEELEAFSSKLQTKDIRFIPISALKGDNIVNRSENMDWYEGGTLLHTLENIHIASDHNHVDCRFPVQYVIRPQNDEFHDYRGYAGRIAGGVFKKGDEVMCLPTGFGSKIKSIDTFNGEINEAFAPMSVIINIEDNIDISRGDMLVRKGNFPVSTQDLDLMVCWMGDSPLKQRGKYIIKHTSNEAKCIIKEITYKVNINTLHRIEDDKNIACNDIARISIRTTKPLFIDSYIKNRNTGSLILIDEASNNTVGACMII